MWFLQVSKFSQKVYSSLASQKIGGVSVFIWIILQCVCVSQNKGIACITFSSRHHVVIQLVLEITHTQFDYNLHLYLFPY